MLNKFLPHESIHQIKLIFNHDNNRITNICLWNVFVYNLLEGIIYVLEIQNIVVLKAEIQTANNTGNSRRKKFLRQINNLPLIIIVINKIRIIITKIINLPN